jgi:hypothetical protein
MVPTSDISAFIVPTTILEILKAKIAIGWTT